MMLRLLRRDDLDTLLTLVATQVPDLQRARSSLRRVLFDDPDTDGALSFFCWAHGQSAPEGVASAVQRGDRGYLKLLYVAPTVRRRGLGAALLAALERRLRARGVAQIEIDGAAPAYLRPGLLATDREAEGFFSRRGYRLVDERISLRLALPSPLEADDLRARVAAQGFEVRRARREDARWLPAAINHHFSSNWATEARLALDDTPPAVHLALREGELAAFACSGLPDPSVFGPTGTVPRYRLRGLGAALLARALDDVAARGCEMAEISWIGPERYYRRLLGPLETIRYRVLRKGLA